MAKKKTQGWLDKYDAPQAQNGIEGTMGGLTDKGFDYNGSWGGQFQMGGNVYPVNYVPQAAMGGSTGGTFPGSTGFMYARTQGAAPSEGPYAKKTMPSAQDGKKQPSNEEQAKEWYRNWYTERAKNPKFTEVANKRLDILPKLNVSYDPDLLNTAEAYGIYSYSPDNYTVSVDASGNPIGTSSQNILHEFGHAFDHLTPQKNRKEIFEQNALTDPFNNASWGGRGSEADQSELLSRVDQWRMMYGIDPNKEYSIDDMKKIIDDFNSQNPSIKDMNYGPDAKFNVKQLFDMIKNNPEKLRNLNRDLVMRNVGQLPVAQDGMTYYQHGLDWKPRNISRDGSEIPNAQKGKQYPYHPITNPEGFQSVLTDEQKRQMGMPVSQRSVMYGKPPAVYPTASRERTEGFTGRQNASVGPSRTNYTRAQVEAMNAEEARRKAQANSALSQTMGSFAGNEAAGTIGAETFVNMNPLGTGQVMSASRLYGLGKSVATGDSEANPYFGSDRGFVNNAFGAINLAGDLGMMRVGTTGTLGNMNPVLKDFSAPPLSSRLNLTAPVSVAKIIGEYGKVPTLTSENFTYVGDPRFNVHTSQGFKGKTHSFIDPTDLENFQRQNPGGLFYQSLPQKESKTIALSALPEMDASGRAITFGDPLFGFSYRKNPTSPLALDYARKLALQQINKGVPVNRLELLGKSNPLVEPKGLRQPISLKIQPNRYGGVIKAKVGLEIECPTGYKPDGNGGCIRMTLDEQMRAIPRNVASSTAIATNKPQFRTAREAEIARAEAMKAKQPVIRQGRQETVLDRAKTEMLKRQYQSLHPNTRINPITGDLETIDPNRGFEMQPLTPSAKRFDKGLEHIMGAIEATGTLTGVGQIGSNALRLGASALEKQVGRNLLSKGLKNFTSSINPTLSAIDNAAAYVQLDPIGIMGNRLNSTLYNPTTSLNTTNNTITGVKKNLINSAVEASDITLGTNNLRNISPYPTNSELFGASSSVEGLIPKQAGFPNPLAIADAIFPQLPHPARIPLMFSPIEGLGPFTGSPLNLVPGYGKVLQSNPNAAFRKFGNTMEHVMSTKTLSPKGGSPIRIGRDQIIGEGNWAALNAPDENYKGVFAAKFDFRNPNTNLGYVNPSNRNGVLITTKSGENLVDIPIQDEGLSFHRRLPFSNRYVPIDKQKLLNDQFQWATQGGHLQSLFEKYGYGLGYAGALSAMGQPYMMDKLKQYTINPTIDYWNKADSTLNKNFGTPLMQIPRQKEGGVIKDNRGQWAHPGKITEIDSNQITMQGVPYPVLGIGKDGQQIMMQPGEEYTFNKGPVTEIPMAQTGVEQTFQEGTDFLRDWYSKRAQLPQFQDLATRRLEDIDRFSPGYQPYDVMKKVGVGYYPYAGGDVVYFTDPADKSIPKDKLEESVPTPALVAHEVTHGLTRKNPQEMPEDYFKPVPFKDFDIYKPENAIHSGDEYYYNWINSKGPIEYINKKGKQKTKMAPGVEIEGTLAMLRSLEKLDPTKTYTAEDVAPMIEKYKTMRKESEEEYKKTKNYPMENAPQMIEFMFRNFGNDPKRIAALLNDIVRTESRTTPIAQDGKTIFVSNPNDPRLKSYSDSLYSYNVGKRLESILDADKNLVKVRPGSPYDKALQAGVKRSGNNLIDNSKKDTKGYKNYERVAAIMDEYQTKGNKGILPIRYQGYFPNPDNTAIDLVTLRSVWDALGVTDPRPPGGANLPVWKKPEVEVAFNSSKTSPTKTPQTQKLKFSPSKPVDSPKPIKPKPEPKPKRVPYNPETIKPTRPKASPIQIRPIAATPQAQMEIPDWLYRVEYTDPETGQKTHKMFNTEKEGSEFQRMMDGERIGNWEKQPKKKTGGWLDKYN